MVGLPPYPDEKPDDLRLTRATDDEWFTPDDAPPTAEERLPRLPVGPGVTKVVHARHATAHAVVAIVPGSGEIRVPYLRRREKGDFKAIMNAMVDEFGIDRFRFTNVFMSDDEATRAYDLLDEYLADFFGIEPMSREDDVRLDEALRGFEHEVEDWEGEPVDTLVGRWER